MRFPILAVLVAVAAICACNRPGAIETALLVENVTIVSAHLDEPLAGQNVLIRGARIESISSTPIAIKEPIERLDGSGMYLTPGLMDSHHHVSFTPGLGPQGLGKARARPDIEAAYLQQQPKSLLYHGVTQVLDPSPLKGWRAFDAAPLHPDLFRCGQIPNPGGYPTNQLGDERALDSFEYIIDEVVGETPEAVVSRIADDGAICVKIYIEDGFGENNAWPLLDNATIGRIRTAAHDNGLTVVAHANAIDMYRIALRNDVDVIAHGLWNWQWPDDAGPPPVAETLDRVYDAGVGYQGTHQVMAGLAGMMRPDTPRDPKFAAVVPKQVLDWYATEDGRWFARELASDFPPGMADSEIAEILDSGYRRAQKATAYLGEKGQPLLLGSDCPGSATYANQPGLCTLRELQSYAAAGVPLQEILEAATLNNASRFGLSKDYGTVQEGKVANLLLLAANPLEDITAWDRIELIILRGQAIPRHTLSATQE